MTTVGEIAAWMQRIAPPGLSEDWDNTGLLLGDPEAQVARVQTCLTVTPESAREAVEQRAQLVLAHHPLPFHPLRQLTTGTLAGSLLWKLASAGIAIYSPHTAWDSAPQGINAQLSELLQLSNSQPLIPATEPQLAGLGAGRVGDFSEPTSLAAVVAKLVDELPGCRPRGVFDGAAEQTQVRRVAIACGSGGSLLPAAIEQQCDLILTGEATFHTCLEAQAAGLSLLMVGHFASERFAMERLAHLLAREYPALGVWASNFEKDPVRLLA